MENRESRLFVLDPTGDVRITWNPSDPASCARAREEVAALKAAGYSFFLVDGEPADEIAAGGLAGTLSCRRVEMEELLPASPEEERTPPIVPEEGPDERPKRGPGRPRKREPVQAVATRPLQGG
jgi:hypothetical protein